MVKSDSSKDENRELCKVGGIAFGLVSLAWIICLGIISLVGNWEEGSGPFGDSFGTLNALFSGLAFAGIIVTLFLQRKELGYQRQELAATREELKRSATAQEETQRVLSHQVYLSAITTSIEVQAVAREMNQSFQDKSPLENMKELSQELSKELEEFRKLAIGTRQGAKLAGE
ncbi:MAG: hypothetical protein KC964_31070 [Candidatus Omnitrophica bacterium]|nr:hypothetical protein [Candidatus Omnitrophota bacterium]